MIALTYKLREGFDRLKLARIHLPVREEDGDQFDHRTSSFVPFEIPPQELRLNKSLQTIRVSDQYMI